MSKVFVLLKSRLFSTICDKSLRNMVIVLVSPPLVVYFATTRHDDDDGSVRLQVGHLPSTYFFSRQAVIRIKDEII